MLLDPVQRAAIQERLQQAENSLRMQMAQINQLINEGRMDTANQLRALVQQKLEKLRAYKTQLFTMAQQAHAQQAQAQGRPVSTTGAPIHAPPVQAPPTASKAPEPPQPSTSSAQVKTEPGHTMPHAPPSTSQNVPAKSTVQITPDMAAQMQKLVEQKNRLPQQTPHPTTTAAPADNKPFGSAPTASRSQWHGTLAWRGFDSETHIRKDVHTRVVVIAQDDHGPIVYVDSSVHTRAGVLTSPTDAPTCGQSPSPSRRRNIVRFPRRCSSHGSNNTSSSH